MTDTNQRDDEPLDPVLAAAIDRLPRSVEPARDLWPAIAHRMPRRRASWNPWMLAAAAVALMVASSAVTVAVLRSRAPSVAAAPPAARDPIAVQRAAARELEPALAAAMAQVSPRAVEALRKASAAADTAIAESEAALAKAPHDAALRGFVVAAYEMKIDLLRRAARLGVPRT